jgi:hypothetical protein
MEGNGAPPLSTQAIAELDRLERWLERAVSAASLAAVLDEPS